MGSNNGEMGLFDEICVSAPDVGGGVRMGTKLTILATALKASHRWSQLV
jgi:hypothetical protein